MADTTDRPPPPATPPSGRAPDTPAGRQAPVIDASREGRVWTTGEADPNAHGPRLPRSFASKMFGIGFFGWIKLVALSVAVGVVLQVANIDPFAPDFTLAGAGTALIKGLANIGLWALSSVWKPALIGAIVVAPLWLAWRLLSSPFRR